MKTGSYIWTSEDPPPENLGVDHWKNRYPNDLISLCDLLKTYELTKTQLIALADKAIPLVEEKTKEEFFANFVATAKESKVYNKNIELLSTLASERALAEHIPKVVSGDSIPPSVKDFYDLLIPPETIHIDINL